MKNYMDSNISTTNGCPSTADEKLLSFLVVLIHGLEMRERERVMFSYLLNGCLTLELYVGISQSIFD
jgi:hypothetical protein